MTCLAYIRIFTNPRAVATLISMEEAASAVDAWLSHPIVSIVSPTGRFWQTFRELLVGSQAIANLCSDAYLAALAIGHGCELCSTDADFARFKRLRSRNPLESKG